MQLVEAMAPIIERVEKRDVRSHVAYIASGEILIVLVEAVVFFLVVGRITWKRALLVSFLANALSYGGGLAIRAIDGSLAG